VQTYVLSATVVSVHLHSFGLNLSAG